jgi:hypothetical protein
MRTRRINRSYAYRTLKTPDELDEKGRIMGIEILNAGKSGLIKQVAKAVAKSTS